MSSFLHLTAFLFGLLLVIFTLLSAVKTFVLPRGTTDRITRAVFLTSRFLFELRMRSLKTYLERDRLMAYYAPVSLLALLPCWLALILAGFGLMFWGNGAPNWQAALRQSGSSLFTLGNNEAQGVLGLALEYSEAAIGLILVALLIAYLPTMYAAFSRREAAVSLLEVRAGSPPSALEMILRFHRIHGLTALHDLWLAWEVWFADVEESHTSLAALSFFRSPKPGHGWVVSAGAVLDAAALANAALDIPHDPQADLCIRGGYLCLRHICDLFRIPYAPHPKPDDPISVQREEFDALRRAMQAEGIPLKPDLEQAWRDYAGWRVNYDAVLIALCSLTMAPPALWSSDRAGPYRGPKLW